MEVGGSGVLVGVEVFVGGGDVLVAVLVGGRGVGVLVGGKEVGV